MSRKGSDRDVLIIDDAFPAASCARVVTAMNSGTPEVAEVLDDTSAPDVAVRRASHIDVDAATFALLDACLDSHRARIEQFFGVALNEREGVSLLRYRAGDFFRRHRDWGVVASWPDAARRRISLVLFLTTSRDVRETGTFSGGALRLFDEEGHIAREVYPEAGRLVAFPSTVLHEVLPVGDGTRDAVVDWFY